jgi:hypothetical protein
MKSTRTLYCGVAALAIAGFAALAAGVIPAANARPGRSTGRYEQSHAANTPILAIVALKEQHVSIYDATGKILEAPVSTGTTGLETPAGIYSVVQKEEEHHSNVYDDASMPFMERITWTGISLHAGVLPGYPASHGCVRMPMAFAQQLYGLTELGMRVIVVREDIVPVDIAQPAMFKPGATGPGMARSSLDGGSTAINVSDTPRESDIREQLKSIAMTKSAEAGAAVRREKEARLAAAKKAAEAAAAGRLLRGPESNLARAEADLKAAERVLEKADTPERTAQAEMAKSQALAKVEAARAQLETSKRDAQAKLDMAARAQEEVQAAAVALNAAIEAAEKAKQDMSPVSVFVSRKTQRLYIRKGNHPVFESDVTIRNSDKPIGTFVFTAVNYTGQSGAMRWNVVSMYKDATNIEPFVPVKLTPAKAAAPRPSDPLVSDAAGAQAALNRLVIPQDALDRISEIVLPGSSLIISDEGPSVETGKDTDFVVIMSGEPQGGITIRQHNTASRRGRDDDDFFGFSRRRRSWDGGGGGGFPFFFSD